MNMQGLHYDLDSMFPENPDFLQEEEVCLKDIENIKRLYPAWIKRISVYVEEYIDRYEYEGSPIYNEYPDDVTVYAMAEDIYYMMADDMENAAWTENNHMFVKDELSEDNLQIMNKEEQQGSMWQTMDYESLTEGTSQMIEESTHYGKRLSSVYDINEDNEGYVFDIIRIMVCNTIYLRRRRHDRFCRCRQHLSVLPGRNA